jgi:hypothetical protein
MMILIPASYSSLKKSLSVSSKSSASVQKQRYAPVFSPNAFSFFRYCLPKICQESGQAHPDAREMFRVFFVAASAKRKTIELSVGTHLINRIRVPLVGWLPDTLRCLVIHKRYLIGKHKRTMKTDRRECKCRKRAVRRESFRRSSVGSQGHGLSFAKMTSAFRIKGLPKGS